MPNPTDPRYVSDAEAEQIRHDHADEYWGDEDPIVRLLATRAALLDAIEEHETCSYPEYCTGIPELLKLAARIRNGSSEPLTASLRRKGE